MNPASSAPIDLDDLPANLTVAAVATFLRMRPRHVYDLIKEGRLKATRWTERKTLIAKEDLRALAEAGGPWT